MKSKLEKLRAELNALIENNADKADILQKSQELDVEILRFYKGLENEEIL